MPALICDAIILAGGRAARLGGATKPELTLAGRRLLDYALEAARGARRTVVVAPDSIAVPPGVARTMENPAHGGPVAAIGAGFAALAHDTAPAQYVLLLSCDAPAAVPAVARMYAALAAAGDEVDGAVLSDDGRPQWLISIVRTAVLGSRLAELAPLPGRSMRALMAEFVLVSVPARGAESRDVDTWDDLEDLRAGW